MEPRLIACLNGKAVIMSIHIPIPCHEDWEQMLPADKGRFCTACSKTVVDFTTMTDEQVNNYLLTHREQKVCGRFLHTQLNRNPLQDQPVTIPINWLQRQPYARQLLYAVALFFVVGVSSCTIMGKSNETTETTDTVNYMTTGIAIAPPPPFDSTAATDTLKPPPKVKQIIHTEPVIKGDVVEHVDSLVEPEPPIPVMMGGVDFPEPPPPIAPPVPDVLPPAPPKAPAAPSSSASG